MLHMYVQLINGASLHELAQALQRQQIIVTFKLFITVTLHTMQILYDIEIWQKIRHTASSIFCTQQMTENVINHPQIKRRVDKAW